jgi:hypothetical protein
MTEARSGGEAARSSGREADPMSEAGNAPPASNGGSGPWMGSAGPWMGLAGLSTCFLFFVFSTRLTEAGKQPSRKITVSVNQFCLFH